MHCSWILIKEVLFVYVTFDNKLIILIMRLTLLSEPIRHENAIQLVNEDYQTMRILINDHRLIPFNIIMGLLQQVVKTCYKSLIFHIDTHSLLRQLDAFVRYNINMVEHFIFM